MELGGTLRLYCSEVFSLDILQKCLYFDFPFKTKNVSLPKRLPAFSTVAEQSHKAVGIHTRNLNANAFLWASAMFSKDAN